MEFLRNILKDIKTDIKISRERKIEKRKKELLTKFFDSPDGKKHFDDIKREWRIKEVEKRKIKSIDNEDKKFRLVLDVVNDNFLDIVRERKPEVLKYRITHQTDTEDAGDLLIEINDKIAVQTSGIIFPETSGVNDMYSKLFLIGYKAEIKDYPGLLQPWRELKKT